MFPQLPLHAHPTRPACSDSLIAPTHPSVNDKNLSVAAPFVEGPGGLAEQGQDLKPRAPWSMEQGWAQLGEKRLLGA